MAMSPMSQHRFLYSLIILLVAVAIVPAQPQRWAALYQENQMATLFAAYQNGLITEPDWQLFVQALQTVAGDSAIRLMARAYARSKDQRLRAFIQERIYQYYYAGGYYQTAEKIRQDGEYILKLLPLQESSQKKYGIQIGAFRSRENALKLKQTWQNKLYDIQIVQIERNGNRLYAVVVGEFSTREAALRYREELNNKWQLRGYIFQY